MLRWLTDLYPDECSRARRSRRRRALATLAAAIALGAARGAAAQGVLDQSFECNSQIYQILYFMPDSQTFTPSLPSLSGVSVNLQLINSPNPTDTITLLVHQGDVTGPVIASGAHVVQSPPTATWERFDFPSPVAVVPGNTYAIELQATNVGWAWAASTTQSGCPDYPGGAAFINPARSVGFDPVDWNFRTYSSCGDGVLDAGEECDAGAANGTFGSCCSSACAVADAGTQCGQASGACDAADFCDGSSPVCPNLFQDAGTPCPDDGETCTSDVCDGAGACIHPAGHAGAVCRPAADPCDAVETCDGVAPACPADQSLPDSDGDGECDVIDPCTNAGAQDFLATPKAVLTLAKINADPHLGDDQLKLVGALTLPAAAPFASLHPDATGVRLVLQASNGLYRADVAVPAGAYSPATNVGWKLAPSGKVWTFVDRTAAPVGGIAKVVLIDRDGAHTPRQLKVVVSGKKSTYPVVAGDTPVQAIVTLGDATAAVAGVCGETAFGAADCAFDATGTTLRCKH